MTGATFHTLSLDEMPLAMDWARREGWNPGVEDGPAFWAGDPEGFFVARVGEEPAAVISVVNHAPDMAFLGLYIAAPEFRGAGIGFALWEHALGHAGDRIVGLDGVPDQQDNYRRSGFELAGETHRYSGVMSGQKSSEVRPVAPGEGDALLALEARACGYDKPTFGKAWFADTETRRTFVLDRDGIEGCVTIRACAEGYKIGPMVAGSLRDAETLIRAAIAGIGAVDVVIDVPDDCPELMAFCADEGLIVSFNTARMYRGKAPVPGPGLRAVATLELG